jgi:hypothetical protein
LSFKLFSFFARAFFSATLDVVTDPAASVQGFFAEVSLGLPSREVLSRYLGLAWISVKIFALNNV